jgi:murein DD-endopeptidase MepM/ murein hydrolase activator NlpD
MFSTTYKKLFLILVIVFLAVSLPGCKVAPETKPNEGEIVFPQAKSISDPTWRVIQQAITKAASGREDALAFLIYNVTISKVEYSPDGNLALVWVEMVDKNTGEILPGEPGLVIAKKADDGSWSVTLQPDTAFAQELMAIPDSMLSQDVKAQYMPGIQAPSKSGTVYSGYRLPWERGQTVRLTGSIGHVYTYKSCPTTCLYAFDFANGTEFPIAAAKAGTVKYAEWRYEDGNTSNTNYLVIEDTTTSPTTYMVYYHLAKNSIPDNLRVPGAQVYQGEYIAKANDTGASTGNHLHFHVHTNSGSVWGTSVDIVFDEVSINGGRPRLCSEVSAYPQFGTQCMPGDRYVSANGDNANPTGGLTLPTADSILTSPTLSISGWMKDDFMVKSGQLFYKTTGNWTALGDPITDTKFSTSINLCQAGIPNGKFKLSLQVTDSGGATSSLDAAAVNLDKEYSCTNEPPVCTVGENQAALFSAPDYQGSCQLLEIGEYGDLSGQPIGDNNTRSVELGSNVSMLLYTDTSFGGTQELYQNGDNDLRDNGVGYNASSAKVVTKITPPLAPTLTLPDGATSEDTITLQWTTEDGVSTRATLTGPGNYSQSLDWQTGGEWSVGSLPAGDYTLLVEANNLAGNTSISQEFSILAPVTLPVVAWNEFPMMVESSSIPLNWSVTTGEENVDHFALQYSVDGGDWQDWSITPAAGDRSATFDGELAHNYTFRIRGVTSTGKAIEWDQAAQAATTTVAGCIKDEYDNSETGDNDPVSATPLEFGTTQTHNWCPESDTDWVSFQATKGQDLVFKTAPVGKDSGASEYLYDTDGVTLLGQFSPADGSSEASLDWTVPVDGTYYIKYAPVNTSISGTDTTYTMSIEKQSTAQTTPVVCGSAAITALLASGYVVVSQKSKKKKSAKRYGWD